MSDYELAKRVETYKSLITVSLELYKALLLINGGGVVAILAYIGTRQKGYHLDAMTIWAAACFLVGLAIVVIAIASSYGVQFSIHSEMNGYEGMQEKQASYFKLTRRCVSVSIIFMILGFIAGMIGIL
jgi:hypothetical protein